MFFFLKICDDTFAVIRINVFKKNKNAGQRIRNNID